jgi:hypothetical protein
MAEVLRSDPHTVVIPPWMSHRLFVRQDSRPVDPHAAKGDGGQVRLLCRSVSRIARNRAGLRSTSPSSTRTSFDRQEPLETAPAR